MIFRFTNSYSLTLNAIVSAKATLILMTQDQPDAALQAAYIKTQKCSYTFSALYPIACALPKLSICSLYLRVFTRADPVNRRITSFLFAFLVANMIAFFLPSAVACSPPSAFWEYPPDLSKCVDVAALGTWVNVPHLATDLVMVVMPMPMVWRLNAGRSKKIGLTVVFLAVGL